jgi:hypothetical protein
MSPADDLPGIDDVCPVHTHADFRAALDRFYEVLRVDSEMTEPGGLHGSAETAGERTCDREAEAAG